MLNQSNQTKVSAVTRKTILFDTKLFFALPCKVSGTKGQLIKAGTPLKGDLTLRDTAFEVAGSSDTPVGILEHDVIINEDGQANAGVLIFGFVDESKLDTNVVAKLDSAMKAKLPKITFCK